MNTKVTWKPRNTTQFNQNVKNVKFLLRYEDVSLSKLYHNVLKASKFTYI